MDEQEKNRKKKGEEVMETEWTTEDIFVKEKCTSIERKKERLWKKELAKRKRERDYERETAKER